MNLKKYLIFSFLITIRIFALSQQTRIDSLESHLEELTAAESIHTLLKLSDLYCNLSFEKSIEYARRAQQIAQTLNNKSIEAKALKNIAKVYFLKSNFESSAKFYTQALNIYKETGEKAELAETYKSLGIVCESLQDTSTALQNYRKSFDIYSNLNDSTNSYYVLNNIGAMFLNTGSYENALTVFFEILKIKKDANDKKGISTAYNNIGAIYNKLNNNAKAIEFFQKALELKKELADKWEIANTLKNIAYSYAKMQQHKQSFFYLEQSLRLALEIEAKTIVRDCYLGISDYYNSRYQYNKALDYYKLYAEMKAQIQIEENKTQISELKEIYFSEKQNKDNTVLREEVAKHISEIDKELEIQTNLRDLFIVIAALLITLFITLLLIIRLRKNSSLNAIMKKEEINAHKRKMEQMYKEIQVLKKQLNEVENRPSLENITSRVINELTLSIQASNVEIGSLINFLNELSQLHNQNKSENLYFKNQLLESLRKAKYSLINIKQTDELIDVLKHIVKLQSKR